MVYVALILFTLIGCALIVVVVQNLATQVSLLMFAWQSPTLPLGLLLLAAFVLGALLLYVVSLLSALPERRENRALHRQVASLELRLQEQAAHIQAMEAAQSVYLQPPLRSEPAAHPVTPAGDPQLQVNS